MYSHISLKVNATWIMTEVPYMNLSLSQTQLIDAVSSPSSVYNVDYENDTCSYSGSKHTTA